MRTKTFLLSIVAMVAAWSVKAQSNPTTVSKGYYSIGDNYKRLSVPSIITFNKQPQTAEKGFYAVENNAIQVNRAVAKPATKKMAVQKGYYSIGNNADKLQ
ncbi:hypothetical protein C3K47_16650 [Solitalea longa]|uniref:Uncharacterized protein n=1 Tax=Solitalea longa TaxID=2079460 RepID=A0A2S4ZY49_9SPHI|nr:hypothetical protein [Solitalea longa]POY35206.1 hypothetical protein C3K47_16650 [Solitalea longa]